MEKRKDYESTERYTSYIAPKQRHYNVLASRRGGTRESNRILVGKTKERAERYKYPSPQSSISLPLRSAHALTSDE